MQHFRRQNGRSGIIPYCQQCLVVPKTKPIPGTGKSIILVLLTFAVALHQLGKTNTFVVVEVVIISLPPLGDNVCLITTRRECLPNF